jgi:hypothetical protein
MKLPATVPLLAAMAMGPCLLACSNSSSGSPPDGGAGTSAPRFTDPNPLPCDPDAAASECPGWGLPPVNQLTFAGCCLTNFPEDSAGKCGVSAAGNTCVEVKAPGNFDPTCGPDAGIQTSIAFGGGNVVTGGGACCMWRTSKCGVMAHDFGCIPFDVVDLQDSGCTPDYANGVVQK